MDERIRRRKHAFEVHFLLAVWTRLFLADDTPASYTELMESEKFDITDIISITHNFSHRQLTSTTVCM